MVKILLVFDDYSELTKTESFLKKIGCDVVGITNEISLIEKILALNPDLLIVSGRNQRVSTIQVSIKVNGLKSFNGKCICLLPKGVRPNPNELLKMKMDALLESPAQPETLITLIAKLKGLPLESLLDKFHRKQADYDAKEHPKEKDKFADSARAEKYRKLVGGQKIDSKMTTHSRESIKKHQDELVKDWDLDEIADQDSLKRQFVDAMFRKK